jgi:hypothetical protein
MPKQRGRERASEPARKVFIIVSVCMCVCESEVGEKLRKRDILREV